MSAKSKQKLLLAIKLGEIRKMKEYERKRIQMDPSVLSSLNSTDYETDMKKVKHKNSDDHNKVYLSLIIYYHFIKVSKFTLDKNHKYNW